MNRKALKPKKRTVPKGSCVIDFISKIVKEEGKTIAFCLTRDLFLDTFLDAFLDPLLNKTASYNNVGVDTTVEIKYTTSKKRIEFLLNDSQDLFTLLFSDIDKLDYVYPEILTELYIIDK